MAIEQTIDRFNNIIYCLRKRQMTFLQIQDELVRLADANNKEQDSISERTFLRDKHLIKALYNIEIVYCKKKGAYIIDETTHPNESIRLLHAYDIFNTIKSAAKVPQYLHFYNSKASSTIYLQDILAAIEHRNTITITHHSFWNPSEIEPTLEPYALKEDKQRWYLIAKDIMADKIKTYGLERIQDVKVNGRKFKYPKDFSLDAMFANTFGIDNYSEILEEPTDIVLSFTKNQQKFIQSLPLHPSQEELIVNDKEYRIKLKQLILSRDLVMQILSYGNNVKIIEPKALVEVIKNELKEILKQYK